MAVYEKQSKHTTDKVIEQAVKFFAGSPPGLVIKEHEDCSVTFEGGGGYVRVTAIKKDKGSTVDVESREWDYWAEKFLEKL